MRRSNLPSAVTLAFAFAFVACRAELAVIDPPAPTPIDTPAVDAAIADTSRPPVTDAGREAEASVVPSDCPAPRALGPANVPAGFLRPVKVTIAGVADGDSGRYNFPNAANQGVRMLWVNTEESFGDDMTAFGVQTKATVIKWITDAKDIQIAVQETSTGSGIPDSDPYDRWLSVVFLDGELLQTRIVREGLSAYYTTFGCAGAPFHDALLHSEAEANKNKRGIWGPGPHNDYSIVLAEWIGTRKCRPNPFLAPYCP